jgi:NAD(P)-dependent dehydrogenase (short-subunit alcohol dehydrogenase family)
VGWGESWITVELCSVGVDVNDEETLQPVITELKGRKIDLLVIAAGSQEVDQLSTLTKDVIRRQMETNAIGPLFTVKRLQQSLQKGSKVITVSYSCSISMLPSSGRGLIWLGLRSLYVNCERTRFCS